MKTWAYVVGLVVPLLGVVAMNQAVDAGGVGASAIVRQLAGEQGWQDLLVAPSQFDHRAWVKTRLLMPSECPDVLVLGSSTVGAIADGMIPNAKLRNAYVGGPTVEDFEALSVVLRASSCKPRAVIVGVDPWWLGNGAIVEQRWTSLIDEYLEYHAEDGPFAHLLVRSQVGWARFEERLNFTTTRESARLLLARGTLRGPRMWREGEAAFCASDPSDRYVRAADGHYVVCANQLPSKEEREAKASSYLERNMHEMNGWREVAYTRLDRFERVVGAWSRTIGRVVLVSMPYHPITYERLLGSPRVRRNLADFDARVAAMAAERVEVVWLRDPAKVPCVGDDFEESHHSAPACARKIATHLVEHTRALGSSPLPP